MPAFITDWVVNGDWWSCGVERVNQAETSDTMCCQNGDVQRAHQTC